MVLLHCPQTHGCHQLATSDGQDLVSIARNYREHPFHVSIGKPLNDGELLALLLYTGCDCNYDLTRCLLSDDYETWCVFDFTLSTAIGILSWHSSASEVPLYTGLADAYVDSRFVDPCGNEGVFLKCHMSTSTKREVAEQFRGDKGLLITIPPQRPGRCFFGWPGNCNPLFVWVFGPSALVPQPRSGHVSLPGPGRACLD